MTLVICFLESLWFADTSGFFTVVVGVPSPASHLAMFGSHLSGTLVGQGCTESQGKNKNKENQDSYSKMPIHNE
jgi:hypothetical protein